MKRITVAILCLALASWPAHAQTATKKAPLIELNGPCNPLGDTRPQCNGGGATAPTIAGNSSLSTLLQQIYDKLHSDGEAIIADMQKAQAVAATKFADGTVADQPSNQCLAAAIPVAQLIVENQLVPAGVTPATGTQPANSAQTPDGLVTAFVKVRVVVNALQSPSLQSGCSWLQQSLNLAGTQGLAQVLGGILGITKLAPVAAGLL
jgi:hypothetical protein